MSRKSKPPPIYQLDVQGLSGSAQSAASAAPSVVSTFIDDFDGSEKPIAPQVVEQAVLVAAHAAARVRTRDQMIAAAQRKHVQTIDEMMQRQRTLTEEFIRKRMQPTLRSPAKAGERSITLGVDLVIVVPAKAWRRM